MRKEQELARTMERERIAQHEVRLHLQRLENNRQSVLCNRRGLLGNAAPSMPLQQPSVEQLFTTVCEASKTNENLSRMLNLITESPYGANALAVLANVITELGVCVCDAATWSKGALTSDERWTGYDEELQRSLSDAERPSTCTDGPTGSRTESRRTG